MTNSNQIDVGKAPHLYFSAANGDLTVKGWTQHSIKFRGDCDLEETDGGFAIVTRGSTTMYVPELSSLHIEMVGGDCGVKGVQGLVQVDQVNGDAAFRNTFQTAVGTVNGDLAMANVEGEIQVEQVNGDLGARRVHGLQIGSVNGDLAGRYIEGSVQVQEISGDISLRTVNDDLTIEQCQRDVNLQNLGGLVQVKDARGDIRLRGGLAAGKHVLTASGDIVVRWSLIDELNLEVTAAEIKNSLPLKDEQMDGNTLTGRLGDGETTLILKAGRRAILRAVDQDEVFDEFGTDFGSEMADFGLEMSRLSERIAGEINSRMSEVSVRLEERFGPEFAQKMAEKAAQKAERAVARAAREAERSRRRAERYQGWTPEPPPQKSAPRASASEQKKVLEMLEQGIISVEEANTLLKAMEG